jgi:hypothetical protein
VPESTTCGALDVDAESIDLAHDRSLCRESESGRSEPSKSWQTGAGHSSDRLGGSAWWGAALCDSEAPVLLGTMRGRTVRWSSRAGRAAGRELEPTFLSCAAVCSRRDDATSVTWGGDDEDDPDMSLQSTAALATSLLHDGSGDGSSLEETPHSPAFRLLMRLSFRSCLAISRSLCCALHAARALFWLKTASSGRGALAETRWAHFNCSGEKAKKSVEVEGPREDRHHNESTRQMRRIKKTVTHKFFCPLVGEHREKPCQRPRVGRPPDRLLHAALDLKRR